MMLVRVLAQSGGGLLPVYAWFAVLLIVVFAAAAALFALRRRLLGRSGQPPSPGLTLGDLDRLRAEGRMTDSEFHAARRVVLRQSGIDPDASASPLNPLTGKPRTSPPSPGPKTTGDIAAERPDG